MRGMGFRWVGGIDAAVYPNSIILAGIYLWTWGFSFIAVGIGATRFANGEGWQW